ncbi:MAG TPA: ATP-binding cassette domain-containing protein [Casimicrobiaceae bacterium]
MGGSLCLTHVRIHAGAQTLIDSLDVTVDPGECVTVLGPPGSGKSVLLAWIAGTLDPGLRARGRASIDGENILAVAPARRGVGLMFQDDLLFPQLSVAGNLMFALVPTVRGRASRAAAVERALREIGLDGCANLHPSALSDGERARVSLMRMLLAQPRILLLDEPFRRFDVPTADEMRRFTFAHVRRRGIPTLLATRERADAEVADGRVIMLAGGGSAAAEAVEEVPRAARRRVRIA